MSLEPFRPRLRFAAAADRAAVVAVLRAAYGGESEARLLARLAEDGDHLFTIVADREGLPAGFGAEFGPIVGVAGFGRAFIDDPARPAPLAAAVLAPLAVTPPLQGHGIAAALIRAGLVQCRKRDIAVALAHGNPRLFASVGFSPEAAAGLETPWSGPYYMAAALRDGLGRFAGPVRYPAALLPAAEPTQAAPEPEDDACPD